MRVLAICALVAVGCGGSGNDDVHGPFTGATRRFYVSSLTLPMQKSDFAAMFGSDGRDHNQFGNLAAALTSVGVTEQHAAEIAAASPTPMLVDITSDDPALRDDPTVGIAIVGAPGAAADQLGAVLQRGVLRSNRVSARHVEAATLQVPLFRDADASTVGLDHFQIDLAPDGDGGFFGLLDGLVPGDQLVPDFAPAFEQMMAWRPSATLARLLDTDRDGNVSLDELRASFLVRNLTAPDVALQRGGNLDHLSIGIAFTLSPCSDAACTHARPAPSCFDRVENGDESDVDCGGSCWPCPGAARCSVAADCVTRACDGGRCRAPSCFDGIRDGFETDIDCGLGCAACQNGAHCDQDADCVSGFCSANAGSTCATKMP